jgi:hypothetical protein
MFFRITPLSWTMTALLRKDQIEITIIYGPNVLPGTKLGYNIIHPDQPQPVQYNTAVVASQSAGTVHWGILKVKPIIVVI